MHDGFFIASLLQMTINYYLIFRTSRKSSYLISGASIQSVIGGDMPLLYLENPQRLGQPVIPGGIAYRALQTADIVAVELLDALLFNGCPGVSIALGQHVIADVLQRLLENLGDDQALRPGGHVVHVADVLGMELLDIFRHLGHARHIIAQLTVGNTP